MYSRIVISYLGNPLGGIGPSNMTDIDFDKILTSPLQVKAAWLAGLQELVERISTKFSAHFASMGFAGQVQLHKGEFENDFENYGVDIMVKYRDREPLQKLTAHHQVLFSQ